MKCGNVEKFLKRCKYVSNVQDVMWFVESFTIVHDLLPMLKCFKVTDDESRDIIMCCKKVVAMVRENKILI